MPVEPIDTLLALKALSLAPDLRENDRGVAAVLIESFNRKTGRCDPGIERIAELLGVSTRTVIRSIHRLEARGLFRKVRHGGHFNRNSYEPVWSAFQEIEAKWNRRFNEKKHLRAPNVSPAGRQSCHAGGDTTVTQTCRSNLQKETCLKRPSKEEKRDNLPLRAKITTIVPRSGDAARVAAERRWTHALHARFVSTPITYGEVLQAIDMAMQDTATDAEMRNRGSGLASILTKLRIPR